MKMTFLALALAAAAVPMTFAAQANPPASNGSKTAPAATDKKAHKKSHKKAVKKTNTAKATSAVKPMAAVPVKK